MKAIKTIVFTTVLTLATSVSASVVVDQSITEAEVYKAQDAWCTALLDISETNRSDGPKAAKALAKTVIDAAYGYQYGAVLFKPTLAVKPQTFRPTAEGALSYFVSQDDNFPKDKGFALKDWVGCESENAAVFITGNTASSVGKVHFTDGSGKVTSVDKTWSWVKDAEGNLRIIVHHSSLEFEG